MTQAAIALLTGRAPPFMAPGVVVGLVAPPLAEIVRTWVVPVSVAMVVLAVTRVDPLRLLDALRRPAHALAVCTVVLVVAPAATAAATLALGAPGWLATGLALAAAAPPLSSAAACAILVKIDAALVTAVSLPATPLAPPTVWGVTSALAEVMPGLGAGIAVTELSLRLGAVILGAFALAFALRRLAGPGRMARLAGPVDAAIVVLVTLIGVGVMHDVGLALRADPGGWAVIFAATWALSLPSCALAVALFWPAGRDRALAAGLAAAVKNMAVMVAAVLGAVEDRIALVVVTAQLPIYVAPLILRPAFARLSRARGPA